MPVSGPEILITSVLSTIVVNGVLQMNEGKKMCNFSGITSRTNWRVIEADGHSERVTRDGAAYYLRIGRSLGYKWIKTETGWRC